MCYFFCAFTHQKTFSAVIPFFPSSTLTPSSRLAVSDVQRSISQEAQNQSLPFCGVKQSPPTHTETPINTHLDGTTQVNRLACLAKHIRFHLFVMGLSTPSAMYLRITSIRVLSVWVQKHTMHKQAE